MSMERVERVLKMGKSMLGVVIAIMLMLVYSLAYGEPGSAPFVVSIFTMGICALFIPYIIYTKHKYLKIRQILNDALGQDVLGGMEKLLESRQPGDDMPQGDE